MAFAATRPRILLTIQGNTEMECFARSLGLLSVLMFMTVSVAAAEERDQSSLACRQAPCWMWRRFPM